jgi:hypothetical protein
MFLSSRVNFNHEQRYEDYKKRSYLRGFCHYPHRGVDAEQHGCKTTQYKSTVQTHLSPSIKCSLLHDSLLYLRTVKIFLAQHLREGGLG